MNNGDAHRDLPERIRRGLGSWFGLVEINTLANTMTSALWTVTLALGLRRGEILGLRWSDCDLKDGRLWVRQALQRQKEQRLAAGPDWQDCGYVFTLEDGRPVTPERVHKGVLRVPGAGRTATCPLPRPARAPPSSLRRAASYGWSRRSSDTRLSA
jgi:integrase